MELVHICLDEDAKKVYVIISNAYEKKNLIDLCAVFDSYILLMRSD